jgi:hypothetical protein
MHGHALFIGELENLKLSMAFNEIRLLSRAKH